MDLSELLPLLGLEQRPEGPPEHLLRSLYARLGEIDVTVPHQGLLYRLRSTDPSREVPLVQARRVTPPRGADEVILRTAIRSDQRGVAGALIQGRLYFELLPTITRRLLYARAASLALRHAPSGPLTLLASHPAALQAVHDPKPRAREVLLLHRALAARPDTVQVHLIEKSLARTLHFPPEAIGAPGAPPPGERQDLTVHQDHGTLHVRCGPTHLTTRADPHVPDVLSALHALLPRLPRHTRLHVAASPAAMHAYLHPDTALGTDAGIVDDIRRQAERKNIDLHFRTSGSSVG